MPPPDSGFPDFFNVVSKMRNYIYENTSKSLED